MRSLAVCEKCKWFDAGKGGMACDVAIRDGYASMLFDYTYYTEKRFKARKLSPACPFKMEQMIISDGENNEKS